VLHPPPAPLSSSWSAGAGGDVLLRVRDGAPGPAGLAVALRLVAAEAAHAAYWSAAILAGANVAAAVLLARALLASWDLMRGAAAAAGARRRRRRRSEKGPTRGAERRKVQLAIVVTGCDSGIGHEVAVHAGRLASRRRGEDGGEGGGDEEDGADEEVAVTVFAGCLLETSVWGDKFRGLPHVRPLLMDVTRDDHVRDAVEAVERWLRSEEEEEEGEKEQLEPPATTTAGAAATPAAASARRYLHAVVNNAGIGIGADADWLSLDQVQRTMDGTDFC
jgi:hypothetical protein